MKFKDKIAMAYKDIINRKFRSFLTIIALSVGPILLMIMLGFGDLLIQEVKNTINTFEGADEITVMPIKAEDVKGEISINIGEQDNSTIKAVDNYEEEIEGEESVERSVITTDIIKDINNIYGVDSIRPYISGSVTGGILFDNDNFKEGNYDIYGIDYNYNMDFSEDVILGEVLDKENPNKILIGERLLNKFGIEDLESVIGKSVVIKAEYPKFNGQSIKDPLEVQLIINGVLDKESNHGSQIVMNLEDASKMVGYYTEKEDYLKEYGCDSVIVYPKENVSVLELSDTISNETNLYAFNLEFINMIFDSITSGVKMFLSIAGVIVLVVAGLGLINTLTMTLQEKKTTMGVMRAVGATKGNLRLVYTLQSLFFGILGGILEIALGSIGIVLINIFGLSQRNLFMPISSNNIVIAIITTILISFLVGLIPSNKAAKMNVVEALTVE